MIRDQSNSQRASVAPAIPSRGANINLGRLAVTAPEVTAHYIPQQGTGKCLDSAVCRLMGARFGHNFSGVRVHTGPEAERTASALNARAFTVGNDIVFGAGEHSPYTEPGRSLIGHELVHVIQQTKEEAAFGTVQQCEEEARELTTMVAAPAQWLSSAPVKPKRRRAGAAIQFVTKGESVGLETLDISAAYDALDKWKDEANELIRVTADWLDQNFKDYLGITKSNPALGWQQGYFYNVMSAAFGEFFGEGIEKLAKSGAQKSAMLASIGALLSRAKWLGRALNILIAVAADFLFDAIFGEDVGKIAFAEGVKMAQLLQVSSESISRAREKSIEELDLIYNERESILKRAVDQQGIDEVVLWASKEREALRVQPDPKNRSLYRAMLHDWILEHAKDEEVPIEDVEKEDWARAVEIAKDPGANEEIASHRQQVGLPERPAALKKGLDLDNHPEIFAYQTRYHWYMAGLPGSKEATNMIAAAEKAIKTEKDPAEKVMDDFDGKKFSFGSAQEPKRLAEFIDREVEETVLLAGWEEKVKTNQFSLSCTLDLEDSDDSVYIDEWEYNLQLKGGLPLYNIFRSWSFDVKPE